MSKTILVGRDEELGRLLEGWHRAKQGDPSLVVVTGEPGLGKTRLIQEFFGLLSRTDDAAEPHGYWPDTLTQHSAILQVNPDPHRCGNAKMPFLWWALRANQPDGGAVQPGVLAGALEGNIRPHLEAALRARSRGEARKKAVSSRVGKIVTTLFKNLTPGVKEVATLIDVSEELGGLLEDLFQLEQRRKEDQGLTPGMIADKNRRSLVVRALDTLTKLSTASDRANALPGVIVFDDAQWISHDPELQEFCVELVTRVVTQRLPLLVVVSHWSAEWHEGLSDEKRLPAQLKRLVQLQVSDWQPLELKRLRSLAPAIKAAFPNLPIEDLSLLDVKAGGNPRMLEYIMQDLQNEPELMRSRALTALGRQTIPLETYALHELTKKRLRRASMETRKAAATAALQGIIFSTRVAADVLERMKIPAPQMALQRTETPLMLTEGVATGRGEFVQRHCHEVVVEDSSRTLPDIIAATNDMYDGLELGIGDPRETLLLDGPERIERMTMIGVAARRLPESDKADHHLLAAKCIIVLSIDASQRSAIGEYISYVKLWTTGAKAGKWRPEGMGYFWSSSAKQIGVIASELEGLSPLIDSFSVRDAPKAKEFSEETLKSFEVMMGALKGVLSGEQTGADLNALLEQSQATLLASLKEPGPIEPLIRNCFGSLSMSLLSGNDDDARKNIARIDELIRRYRDFGEPPANILAELAIWRAAVDAPTSPATDTLAALHGAMELARSSSDEGGVWKRSYHLGQAVSQASSRIPMANFNERLSARIAAIAAFEMDGALGRAFEVLGLYNVNYELAADFYEQKRYTDAIARCDAALAQLDTWTRMRAAETTSKQTFPRLDEGQGALLRWVRTQNLKGLSELSLRQIDLALAAFKQATDRSKEAKDDGSWMKCHDAIAVAFSNLGRVQAAVANKNGNETLIDEAVEHLKRSADHFGKAMKLDKMVEALAEAAKIRGDFQSLWCASGNAPEASH